jgi:hypothetical protein
MSSTDATEQRYVDAEAYKAYASHPGQELTVTKLVAGTPAEAFDALIQHAWLAAGKTLTEGSGRGYVGHSRELPGGVVEQIMSVGEPDADASSARIPSIRYAVQNFGSLPAQDHLGLVSFVPDASAPSDRPATLIVWQIKLVTTWVGTFVTCGGALLRFVLRGALQKSLDRVAAKLEADK